MLIMLPDTVAKVSLELYNSLGKTGKPSIDEWTVLASILTELDGKFEVVALGTGTKCIGKSQIFARTAGTVLHDSHAEVICRRAFMRYLYNEMLKESSEILRRDDDLFKLRDGIKFHMYSSLMPCGDASIFPKSEEQFDEAHFGDILHSTFTDDDPDDLDDSNAKRAKLDFHRTGAKCLPNDKVDRKEFGSNYHVLGAVRTKPGRGDPTVSASCSDKLAKWILLGLQGNLLSLLLEEPIYLSSITIGNEHFCKEALERALYKRFEEHSSWAGIEKFQLHKPDILQCTMLTFNSQKSERKQPAPASIVYIKHCKVEVAVEGLKQGVTKKNRNTASARLAICKLALFHCFLEVAKKVHLEVDSKLSYNVLKRATHYANCWNEFQMEWFKAWPKRNSTLDDFYCD